MKCVNCGADLKSEWAFCPHCGVGVSEPLRPEVQIKLFVKEFSDGRKEYRYGPEWVAAELLAEGGYATPAEAVAAWKEEERDE